MRRASVRRPASVRHPAGRPATEGAGADPRPNPTPEYTPGHPPTRSPQAGELKVALLTGPDLLSAAVPQWLRLYAESDLGNPNLHPAWVLAWYRTFVPERDVVLGVVHAGPRLVGVAPMWRMRLAGSRGPWTLQLVGAGRHGLLSDSPGILSATGVHRKVVKAVADEVDRLPGWLWFTGSLSPVQGWSDQLVIPGRCCVVPRVGRTYVISALPQAGELVESGLKRNVRESIRRATNRLKRAGPPWSVQRADPSSPSFAQALQELIGLHSRRAQLAGHKSHTDVFRDPRYVRLLMAAASGPGGRELMTVYTLRLGGRPLAAQLVVHAPTTTMLVTSGIDPDGWTYSPMALITREIIGDAVAAGRTRLNHSAGPDTGKLRWSETMEASPEFSVLRTSPLARTLFMVHSQLAVGAGVRRERARAVPATSGDIPT
jgi:CelD/BcsL family acetyltransferase involved in cellulose biosynthesis